MTNSVKSLGSFTVRSSPDDNTIGVEKSQFSPALTNLPNAGFAVTWQDGNARQQTLGEIFTTSGKSTASFAAPSVENINQVNPTITKVGTEHFAVAWQNEQAGDRLGLQGAVFTEGGQLTAPFTVPNVNDGSLLNPDITQVGMDTFAVSWQARERSVS